MSIDKFGHFNDHGSSKGGQKTIIVRGPPGVGFKLDRKGNYNMSGMKLTNVGRAGDIRDAVNYTMLNDLSNSCLKYAHKKTGEYDARNSRIINIANPLKDNDAIHLKYLQENCLMFGKRKKENERYEDEAVDVKNFRLRNVKGPPTESSEVACKSYVDSLVISSKNGGWDFQNKQLTNVGLPINPSDGVNKEYLNTVTPSMNSNGWNFSSKPLKLIGDPTETNDAVSVNYLVRLLSEVMFDQYNTLCQPKDKISLNLKNEWMKTQIVDKYFLSLNQ